jgi:VWFA-related protein
VTGQLPFPLFSQTKEKPLQHEVEVVLIEIPLYIIDKKGNPIKDLKPEEITLYENGKKQKISHFVLIQNDSPQIASLARKYPAARRQFLLLFDFAFATSGRIIMARKASLDFIREKIFPTDLVAVASYSGIGGLKILSNFTNDREQLFYTVNTLGLVDSDQRMTGPAGFTFPSLTQASRATGDFNATKNVREMADAALSVLQNKLLKKTQHEIYKAYVSDFITNLNKLSIALNAIRGRKHIIYFSEGFDSKALTGQSLAELGEDTNALLRGDLFMGGNVDSRFGDAALRTELYEALTRISSSDCPIHTIDVGGLRTRAGGLGQVSGEAKDIAAIHRGQDTLTLFSRETGGQAYRNTNDLDRPLENLLKTTNSYYIIGFYPDDKKKEGRLHKIKIKTTRPGVDISYRKGYFETKPYKKYSSLEKKLQLVEYITKDITQNEIQFDTFISAFRGKEGICQVPIFLKFPGRQFLDKKKQTKLEIYGYAISSSGVFKDFFFQTVTISPEKVRKELELQGIKYYDLHLLSPGDYKIKLIVRDKNTGEIGCQIQEVSVPDYEKQNLALTGPVFIQSNPDWILSRGYDPKAPTGRKKGINLPVDYPFLLNNKPFVPGVVPILKRSYPAQFYLRAYNLRLHPQTQVPQTEIVFEIIDAEGKSTPLKNAGLLKTPTQPEPGVFELLFQTSFANFSSGPYQLKITFKDSLANQEVVEKTTFILQ